MRLLVFGDTEAALAVARDAASAGDDVRCIVSPGPLLERFLEHVDGLVIAGTEASIDACMDDGLWEPDAVAALYVAEERNAVASRLARKALPGARIVALANNPGLQAMLEERLGVIAVSPSAMVSGVVRRMSRFSGLLSGVSMHSGNAGIFEISVQPNNPHIGKSLAMVDLPAGAVVSCVIRQRELTIPRGDLELIEGDELIVLCRAGCEEAALRHLTGDA